MILIWNYYNVSSFFCPIIYLFVENHYTHYLWYSFHVKITRGIYVSDCLEENKNKKEREKVEDDAISMQGYINVYRILTNAKNRDNQQRKYKHGDFYRVYSFTLRLFNSISILTSWPRCSRFLYYSFYHRTRI